jgi:hypothetical protein
LEVKNRISLERYSSGVLSLEVMCGLISMQVELGLEKSERLESIVEGQQVRYILPPMRLETRLILKSIMIAEFWAKGARAIIPRRVNSTKENLGFDDYIYKQRHLVENLFAKLKHYRSIATRFEKLARNFRSMIFVASSIICSTRCFDTLKDNNINFFIINSLLYHLMSRALYIFREICCNEI